jgi:diacylglycerol kinase (ATP)
MRVLAIAGPRCGPEHLLPFRKRLPHLQVLSSPELENVEAGCRMRPDAILIFGGDGTLNRHLHALLEAQVPMLAIPTGSGNDFALANGVANVNDAEAVFAAFLSGSAQIARADVGMLRHHGGSGRLHAFACCVNVGLDAAAAARANALPDWLKSRRGYFIAAAISLLTYQPQMITVAGSGVSTLSEEAWFVSVSNTPTFGGGLKIAPEASITDSQFDVTYLPRIPRPELIRHFPKILTGAHTALPFLRQFRASALEIYTEHSSDVYADGEYMGRTPIQIDVAPRSLPVIRVTRFD